MKDTILTARRKKTELFTLLICFAIANLANLYAIIMYRASFQEMLTSVFYVTVFALALYVLWSVLRLLYNGAKALFGKKERDS